jgi:hypothetical protein
MPQKPTPVALLEQLANRHRRRLASCNIHDSNVCTSTLDWQEALDSRAPPPDRFRHELKLKHRGRPVTLRSNDQFVAIEVRGDFGIDAVFSINRRDRVMMTSPRLSKRTKFRKWLLFVDGVVGPPSILEEVEVRCAIEALELDPHESLHVYRNGLTLYSRPTSDQRLADLLGSAVAVAERLPAAEKVVRSFAALPSEFRSLVPMIRRWAVSDDAERMARMERASRGQLELLVRRLTPVFPAINKYLDSFGGTPSEPAVALGTLAECATEAELLLRRRGHTAARQVKGAHPKTRRASRKQTGRPRTKRKP